jgi:hypothetical protein
MGRILFLMFVAFILLLVAMVINKYLNGNNNATPSKNSRKSFDDDIQAVAKEIKKQKEK